MNKYKYFEVTTTVVEAPAVKEVKKIPPFLQAAKRIRITATETVNYKTNYSEPETAYWLEAVKKLLNIK